MHARDGSPKARAFGSGASLVLQADNGCLASGFTSHVFSFLSVIRLFAPFAPTLGLLLDAYFISLHGIL